MSTTQVQLVFEGTAVQRGTIDAQLFADALAGYCLLFRRANDIVNGRASEAAVLVDSDFRKGSFIVSLQFEQHLLDAALNLITDHQFLTAGSLAAMIGLAAPFAQFERGRDPARRSSNVANTRWPLPYSSSHTASTERARHSRSRACRRRIHCPDGQIGSRLGNVAPQSFQSVVRLEKSVIHFHKAGL